MLTTFRITALLACGIAWANQTCAQTFNKFPVLKVTLDGESILLVGSNHSAPLNIFEEQAEQVIIGAKSLCLEVIPSEQEVLTKALRPLMLNTTGRTLTQRHGKQLADEVANAMAWNSLIAAKLDNFSDYTLSTFLWLRPPDEQEQPAVQMRPDYSIDAALLRSANQRNLKLRSIEDLDAIPNAAASVSESEWADYLRKSVELSKCKECRQEYTEHMTRLYAPSPNYEAAYHEVRLAFRSVEGLFDRFDRINLGVRNPGLARNIYARALSHHECDVVAIGGAHLGGPTGVVSLLRKMGATITPLPSSN